MMRLPGVTPLYSTDASLPAARKVNCKVPLAIIVDPDSCCRYSNTARTLGSRPEFDQITAKRLTIRPRSVTGVSIVYWR